MNVFHNSTTKRGYVVFFSILLFFILHHTDEQKLYRSDFHSNGYASQQDGWAITLNKIFTQTIKWWWHNNQWNYYVFTNGRSGALCPFANHNNQTCLQNIKSLYTWRNDTMLFGEISIIFQYSLSNLLVPGWSDSLLIRASTASMRNLVNKY